MTPALHARKELIARAKAAVPPPNVNTNWFRPAPPLPRWKQKRAPGYDPEEHLRDTTVERAVEMPFWKRRSLDGTYMRMQMYRAYIGFLVSVEDYASTGGDEQFALLRDIQARVCRVFGISMAEMLGPRQTHKLILPRHIAMYLAREKTGLSFPKIGKCFGDRDHTTALNGWRRTIKRMETEPALAKLVDGIWKQVGACK